MKWDHLLVTSIFLEPKIQDKKLKFLVFIRGGSRQPHKLKKINNSLVIFFNIPFEVRFRIILTWVWASLGLTNVLLRNKKTFLLYIVLGCVCFLENSFRETTFQTFLCLFAIRKVGQRKALSGQRKFWLDF